MKKVLALLSVCVMFVGDTTAPPQPPPRRTNYRDRFVELCLTNPDPDVRRVGRLLDRRVFALITNPTELTLPRIGFGLHRPLKGELTPAIYAQPEYLRDAGDLTLLFEQQHEVTHVLQFFQALESGQIRFEEWINACQRCTGNVVATELARSHFLKEVEAYHRGALFAQEQGWGPMHVTCEVFAAGGVRALAHTVANQYLKTGRYDTTSIPPDLVHRWAEEYAQQMQQAAAAAN